MLVIALCASPGYLLPQLGAVLGKSPFTAGCTYRLRLLSAASSRARCLWLVARRTGDTLVRSDRGLRARESRPSRGPYHEFGSMGPARRLDFVASHRARDRPGARAYELPQMATLEEE